MTKTSSGSCQASNLFNTYDRETGKALPLGDALDAQADLAALVADLAGDFTERYDATGLHKSAVEGWLRRQDLKKLGVYADADGLWVNINSFAVSCADGSLYPVRVPAKYISNATILGAAMKEVAHHG